MDVDPSFGTDVDPTLQEASMEFVSRFGLLPHQLQPPSPIGSSLTIAISRRPSEESRDTSYTTPLDIEPPIYPSTRPANSADTDEVAEYRLRTRELYGLPELRFSDNPDSVAGRLEELEMALEDAETAVSFESLDEAHTYATVAHVFARQLYGDDNDHPTIRGVQDYLRSLADRQSQRDRQEDEDEAMEDIF